MLCEAVCGKGSQRVGDQITWQGTSEEEGIDNLGRSLSRLIR